MAGDVNCIFTKALIPFLEREVGPEGVAALLRVAGRPRDYLTAEYNSIPLELADRLVRCAMALMGEPDEERWARRYGEDFMDWKPSREERAWAGAYTMSLGSPRAVFTKAEAIKSLLSRCTETHVIEMRRRRAAFRFTPLPGIRIPRWLCTWQRVCFERYPMNWGLPRAVIVERHCAAAGADACHWEVRWKNPPLGAVFWLSTAAGAAGSLAAVTALGAWPPPAGVTALLAGALPVLLGAAVGHALRAERQRRRLQRLLDLQGDEIVYSSRVLERKFRDLEAKVEQLSLLIDLGEAVNATLDPETIYDQALARLVDAMGYQGAHLFLVDRERGRLRAHKMAGGGAGAAELPGRELSLDATSAVGRAATTGRPVVVDDVETATEPVDRPTAQVLDVRSLVSVPLRAKHRVLGVLTVVSSAPGRFGAADVELLSAVANDVTLAIDRAESFRTIEELSRGLEEKVRVRTEQLRAANEELQAAYRHLQATQVQLVQREKMASVGQLVAGVAHELNNPIGFVSSNVSTLEDFVTRLRQILDAYRGRARALPEAERRALDAEWDALRIDYALRFLDPMLQGIREGAERTRKIVRDLRVFARSGDDAWQTVDLHEELESSLTLLNHLLKDRVTVHRKLGDLPPVECVRSQIDQVFLNLLANAAQAIPGPGAITIETRQEDGLAVVSIADTGSGIPPEILGRIFDPFFTTKPVGEGTGLGLSISYEIVKKHGGEITAVSAPGGGATLTVRIPLVRRR
jgi:two-component system NtrC family sensor kinase